MDKDLLMPTDKIILICATGRSGSTTMQRIINTIPNSNICGENFGAINSLLEFYKRLKVSTFTHIPGRLNAASYEDVIKNNVKPAWYNSYRLEEMVQMIKETIIRMLKNRETTNVWGFKEIRYDSGNINYIKEFKELFPQTKIIIQIRENISAQSKSSWFRKDKNAVNYLTKTNKELVDFYNANKNYCYLTSFERMFDLNNIQNIFTFIGCKEYYSEQLVKDVLNNNIKD